ncbi:DUF1217 domain-containing protein [Hyphomicrobium sp. xq]|uniref:DUF1217 domain-containing protein n=1 Tax=Hyphomicrobium album TaxID=2665159 RepID=A0A6I3KM41_9HYPH|nr:DUF1217 domain-containing protein [Hyphomicrobium album]MTD94807.1 DUF1217 domain-containing protein [Hyphomicrobium album]
MLPTLASYRQVSGNIDRSLRTTAAQPQVARETEYYLANIDDVKSVDDLLKDQRLFAYAMKAYGLEDMTYAKAFMRKVLESDLNDKSSFVNKLSDKRYLEFAKAFHFLPSGDVELGLTTAQDSASEDAMIGLYSQQRIRKGETAAAEAAYYESRIGSITNVDQLLSDERLFKFALTASGLDASVASVSAIRNVLTSDLLDPNSVANLYGAKYQELAAAFSFEADGSVVGGSAQTTEQANQTMLAYYEATDTDESPAAAAFKTDYFNDLMVGVTNVDDLVDNEFLRSTVATAAGLDPVLTTAATVREILVSDLSDPDSAANKSSALKAVAQAFNFNTDGSLDSGVAAQDPDQAKALTDLFTKYYDDGAISAEQSNTQYYRNAIGRVSHVDALLTDSKLYSYMLSSYGIDPSEVTKTQIKRVLLSDPKSPTSYTSLLQDSRFTALASAFNFDSDGVSQGIKQVQTASAAKNTIARYNDTLGDLKGDQTLGKAESQYYDRTILTISSVDQLLKDQRLKAYIVRAYGLGKDVSDDTLRKVLTSDQLDPRSFVNKSNSAAYKDLAADFNFNSDGTVARSAVGLAQHKSDVVRTQGLYYRQTVEEDAGSQNEGVRLALYFERKASSITSAYSLLADKALLQVAQTALGLPATMSLLDIDRQAEMISNRIDIEDFKDPAKLQTFLTRFSGTWDVNNASAATSTSPAAVLITQPTESFVSVNLLTSLQNLKLGGA